MVAVDAAVITHLSAPEIIFVLGVLKCLGPDGGLINIARSGIGDEPTLVTALINELRVLASTCSRTNPMCPMR